MECPKAHAELVTLADSMIAKSAEPLSKAAAYAKAAEMRPELYARAVGGAPDARLVKMHAEMIAKRAAAAADFASGSGNE